MVQMPQKQHCFNRDNIYIKKNPVKYNSFLHTYIQKTLEALAHYNIIKQCKIQNVNLL